jgi:hypothetical protein
MDNYSKFDYYLWDYNEKSYVISVDFFFRHLPYKMSTASERTQCLYWYAESGKSVVTVQRNYRQVYRKKKHQV